MSSRVLMMRTESSTFCHVKAYRHSAFRLRTTLSVPDFQFVATESRLTGVRVAA
jgi:hypothetical protein